MSKQVKIAVIGTGSWGTAIAYMLAKCRHGVIFYGIDKVAIDNVNNFRENKNFLPNVKLPQNILASADTNSLVTCTHIFLVVPSQIMSLVCADLKAKIGDYFVRAKPVLISCAKGIEQNSSLRMSQIIKNFFPASAILALSGPSHAEEVGAKVPTAVALGCEDYQVAKEVQKIFSVSWFRVYITEDVIGMEIAGAVKNILAVASGICVGLGLGDNAQAALITRGLAEMIRLGGKLGAKQETFVGLSGVGDLIVTCFSHHSRNFRFGKMLGEGVPSDTAQEKIKMVVEGMPNTKSIYNLAKKEKIRTPLIDEAHAILYENKSPKESLQNLLSKQSLTEFS